MGKKAKKFSRERFPFVKIICSKKNACLQQKVSALFPALLPVCPGGALGVS
jgi:hypothetical protein